MKIAVQLQLIVHFTKYSVKCGGYQRGGPAVTILLVPLSACSSSCKTPCPLTEAAPVPLRLLPLVVSTASLQSHLHPPASPACSLSSLLIIPLHLHPLCSVKPIGALLSMLRTTAGCLVGREDKHWQGTSIVLSPHNNQRIGASFDFPTVWVSLLRQYLLQTPDQPLSILLYITFSPLCLSPSTQCAGNCEGIYVLEGQRVWELEGKVNGVDRWIWYQYRLFCRTRPPPIPRSAVRSEVWHPSS